MSTRALIGIVEEGAVRMIYTHWDGYPEHHMPLLRKNYDTPEKINELMDLGDLSILGPSIGEKVDYDEFKSDHPLYEKQCLAYGRDRGEENVGAREFALADFNKEPAMGAEYLYLFSSEKGWNHFTIGFSGYLDGRELDTIPMLFTT